MLGVIEVSEAEASRFVFLIVLLIAVSTVLGCQLNGLLDAFIRRIRIRLAKRRGKL